MCKNLLVWIFPFNKDYPLQILKAIRIDSFHLIWSGLKIVIIIELMIMKILDNRKRPYFKMLSFRRNTSQVSPSTNNSGSNATSSKGNDQDTR